MYSFLHLKRPLMEFGSLAGHDYSWQHNTMLPDKLQYSSLGQKGSFAQRTTKCFKLCVMFKIHPAE